MIQAIQVIFPNSNIHGCLFHFAQSLWRKVQVLGLSKLYNENKEVRNAIKRTVALSFLPLHAINYAWKSIRLKAPQNIPALSLFFDYTSKTWLDNSAIFPKNIWNHYQNFNVRTTNHLEGWHNALNREFGKAHPNIYEFINGIKNQQANFEASIILMDNGNKGPRRKNKYVRINNQIETFTKRYNNGEMPTLEFLDSVGWLLHLQSH